MPPVKVHIKWQKELFENVEVELDQPPAVFKAQLFTLTGVPPERQKIMVKGGLLKDDGDWGKAGVKEGQRLMMMGTADKLPEAPTTAPVFVEDLPEDEQDMTGMSKYGAGLQNLGNTCYLNSSLQCLYSVPELRSALQAYPDAGGGATAAAGDLNHRVSVTLKKLFEDMDRSAQAVAPFPFLLVLREKYPQFAEQAQGIYKQQDAEECYTQLVWTLKECLKEQTTPVIEKLFGVKLHTSLKSDDSGETIEEDSTIYSLKCNISIDVNYLHQGVELALQDDRERHSDAVGGNTLFRGRSRISQLPPYVNVQLVRFFYKVDVQQKAKILRKVVFPLIMDLYDQCTDEYKKTLDGPRAAFKVAEDMRAGVHKRQKTATATAANGAAAAPKDDQPSSSGGDVDMSDAAGGSGGQTEEVVVANPEELLAKHAGQLTGRYDLTAVLTHKGRSADSGHYVAWVKEEDGSWIQFDDEELIPRKADEIQTLAGGGDWHMAYLLLYRAVRVPTDVKLPQ